MSEATPTPEPRLLDYVAALLAGEAALISIGARVTAVRRALLARALAFKEQEGVAPTLRAKGLGMVILSDPQPKVVIRDRTAWEHYVASEHPTEATAVLRVPVTALTEEFLAAYAAVVPGEASPAIEVNGAFEKVFLSRVAVVTAPLPDDAPEGSVADRVVLAPETGDILEFMAETEAGVPSLSVRLDTEAKARAVAEVQDALADGMLTALTASAPGEVLALYADAPLADLCPDCGQRSDAHPADYHVSRETDEAEGVPDEPDADEPGSRYESMKVAELREECRFHDLPVSGSKAELLARLLAAVSS